MTLLSILICTMPERQAMYKYIYDKICNQIKSLDLINVEVLSNSEMNITTGYKRNLLIQESQGEYVVFIDDDDDVYDYYVSEIINTLESNPNVDCIGINGIITFNGSNAKKWIVSKEYKTWHETAEVYYRTPNHLTPIKRSIAIKTPYPDVTKGEDFAFSIAVYDLIHTEVIIEKPMYHYKFNQSHNQVLSDGGVYRAAWR